MKRFCMLLVVFIYATLSNLWASPVFEKNAPPSLADHLHLSHSKDPIDGGWLADLTGLPGKYLIDLITKYIAKVVTEERNQRCLAVDKNLRIMVFQQFAIQQNIANAQKVKFDKKVAHKWAHILAMILKESSGDSTSITDMSGRSISTYQSQTNLRQWRKILNLSLHDRIKLNYQTNFGLTQTSADRLFVAFKLAQNRNFDTDFLEGKEGASTPRKVDLNTAIAIRRLIWFYQDFAQGRIKQSDLRIHPQDIHKPEYYKRYQAGLEMALLYCGTKLMFQPSPKLTKAMAEIAYCKLGNPHGGYGKNEFDEKCFAEWVTLCPALNLDIAILTPLSYFATRGAHPVCEGTFIHLIDYKPELNGLKPINSNP